MVDGWIGITRSPSVKSESTEPSKSKSVNGVRAKIKHIPTHKRMNLLKNSEPTKTLFILNMLHALLKQMNNMLIFDGIINFLALFARGDQAHLPQSAHVV